MSETKKKKEEAEVVESTVIKTKTSLTETRRQRCRSCGKNRPLDHFVGRKFRPTKQCRKCNLVKDDVTIANIRIIEEGDANLRTFTSKELRSGVVFESASLFIVFRQKFLDSVYQFVTIEPAPGIVIDNPNLSVDDLIANVMEFSTDQSLATPSPNSEDLAIACLAEMLCTIVFRCVATSECVGELALTIRANGLSILTLVKDHVPKCREEDDDVPRRAGRKRKKTEDSAAIVVDSKRVQGETCPEQQQQPPFAEPIVLQDQPVHWELVSRFDQVLAAVQSLPPGDLKRNTIDHMFTVMDMFARDSANNGYCQATGYENHYEHQESNGIPPVQVPPPPSSESAPTKEDHHLPHHSNQFNSGEEMHEVRRRRSVRDSSYIVHHDSHASSYYHTATPSPSPSSTAAPAPAPPPPVSSGYPGSHSQPTYVPTPQYSRSDMRSYRSL
jgi:hypothetical protein